jgi:uncharacterized protein (TIGR02118 family)
MRRPSSWLLCPALVLAAACGETRDRAADASAEDTAAISAPAGETAAIVTVLYNPPKDTAAFEKYYSETHLPLVMGNQGEIGFQRAELTRFDSNLDGSRPARYRQAELYFPSLDALKKGIATPGFKQVADNLPKFATGGLDALIGVETK